MFSNPRHKVYHLLLIRKYGNNLLWIESWSLSLPLLQLVLQIFQLCTRFQYIVHLPMHTIHHFLFKLAVNTITYLLHKNLQNSQRQPIWHLSLHSSSTTPQLGCVVEMDLQFLLGLKRIKFLYNAYPTWKHNPYLIMRLNANSNKTLE